MPIYDIKCLECNSIHEVLFHNTKDKIKCPKCGSLKVKKLISVTSSITGKSSFDSSSPSLTCCGKNMEKSNCERPGSCCGRLSK